MAFPVLSSSLSAFLGNHDAQLRALTCTTPYFASWIEGTPSLPWTECRLVRMEPGPSSTSVAVQWMTPIELVCGIQGVCGSPLFHAFLDPTSTIDGIGLCVFSFTLPTSRSKKEWDASDKLPSQWFTHVQQAQDLLAFQCPLLRKSEELYTEARVNSFIKNVNTNDNGTLKEEAELPPFHQFVDKIYRFQPSVELLSSDRTHQPLLLQQATAEDRDRLDRVQPAIILVEKDDVNTFPLSELLASLATTQCGALTERKEHHVPKLICVTFSTPTEAQRAFDTFHCVDSTVHALFIQANTPPEQETTCCEDAINRKPRVIVWFMVMGLTIDDNLYERDNFECLPSLASHTQLAHIIVPFMRPADCITMVGKPWMTQLHEWFRCHRDPNGPLYTLWILHQRQKATHWGDCASLWPVLRTTWLPSRWTDCHLMSADKFEARQNKLPGITRHVPKTFHELWSDVIYGIILRTIVYIWKKSMSTSTFLPCSENPRLWLPFILPQNRKRVPLVEFSSDSASKVHRITSITTDEDKEEVDDIDEVPDDIIVTGPSSSSDSGSIAETSNAREEDANVLLALCSSSQQSPRVTEFRPNPSPIMESHLLSNKGTEALPIFCILPGAEVDPLAQILYHNEHSNVTTEFEKTPFLTTSSLGEWARMFIASLLQNLNEGIYKVEHPTTAELRCDIRDGCLDPTGPGPWIWLACQHPVHEKCMQAYLERTDGPSALSLNTCIDRVDGLDTRLDTPRDGVLRGYWCEVCGRHPSLSFQSEEARSKAQALCHLYNSELEYPVDFHMPILLKCWEVESPLYVTAPKYEALLQHIRDLTRKHGKDEHFQIVIWSIYMSTHLPTIQQIVQEEMRQQDSSVLRTTFPRILWQNTNYIEPHGKPSVYTWQGITYLAACPPSAHVNTHLVIVDGLLSISSPLFQHINERRCAWSQDGSWPSTVTCLYVPDSIEERDLYLSSLSDDFRFANKELFHLLPEAENMATVLDNEYRDLLATTLDPQSHEFQKQHRTYWIHRHRFLLHLWI